MKVLRILVKAPGGWTAGLDSYTRGEGRWALNVARSLALMGHDVYVWSGGDPDRRNHYGVTLLSGQQATELNDVDVYIDGGMYEGEIVPTTSRLEITAFWSLEPRLLKPLPENRVIVYPYAESKPKFDIPENTNREATFFLPAPFTWEEGKQVKPASPHSTRIFSTLRLAEYGTKDMHKVGAETISEYFHQAFGNPSEEKHLVVAPEFVLTELSRNKVLSGKGATIYSALPYNRVRDIIYMCDINVPIFAPSSILDATFEGVPTVIFECGGFFASIAEMHDLLVKRTSTPAEMRTIMNTLLYDFEKRTKYVADLQELLVDHTHYRFIKHFNHICKARDIL